MFIRFFLIVCVLSVEAERILVVIPSPAYSHAVFASTIYKELARRGHEVVAFTAFPSNDEALKTLEEIQLSFKEWQVNNLIESSSAWINFISQKNFVKTCDIVYNNNYMQELLTDPKTSFDLVMIEYNVVPCFSILKHHFNSSLIGLRSLGLRLEGHDYIGNPTNPSYIDPAYNSFSDSLFGRIKEVLFGLNGRLNHYLVTVPVVQRVVEEYFVNFKGKVTDLEKDVDLVLANTNYILNGVRPNVPAYIDVGMIHVGRCRKNLTQIIKTFLDSSLHGFILFNLGSLIKANDLSPDKLKIILEAFRSLPYNIIWKFESDGIANLPNNVRIFKWVPQESVLDHPNIKGFITHGGLLSLQEAIYYQVPVVVIPFLFDQPSNAEKVEYLEIGKKLDYKTLDSKTLKQVVMKVSTMKRYKHNIRKISKLLQDQIVSPMEKAMWYIEYVLRHKGAPYIKSKAVNINWITYLLLDVFAVVIICFALVIFAIRFCMRTHIKIKEN